MRLYYPRPDRHRIGRYTGFPQCRTNPREQAKKRDPKS